MIKKNKLKQRLGATQGHPLLYQAMGKLLSVMRQIYRDWSPAIHHQPHTKHGISLFKYTQIQLSGKENIVVSPDTEEGREQSCQTGYLTGSYGLT